MSQFSSLWMKGGSVPCLGLSGRGGSLSHSPAPNNSSCHWYHVVVSPPARHPSPVLKVTQQLPEAGKADPHTAAVFLELRLGGQNVTHFGDLADQARARSHIPHRTKRGCGCCIDYVTYLWFSLSCTLAQGMYSCHVCH